METDKDAREKSSPEANQIVLLLDDDPLVTEGLSIGLEHRGRTIVICNDLQSGELALEWFKPSHVVADVRLSGPFAYEGLDFIRYAKAHSPATRVILISGDAPDDLQLEASERGAVAFLKKPFGGRELGAVIELMAPDHGLGSGDPALIRMPMMDEIIQGDDLKNAFQPIVELGESWQPFGYEALARFHSATPFANPERLFAYAERTRRVWDLERACLSNTIDKAAPLVKQGLVFINIHPSILSDGLPLGTFLIDLTRAHNVAADRIVLELTEQAALIESPKMFQNIEQLREAGIRFAFDDFGIAYSHLPLIDRIRPSFLKISQHFGTHFEENPTSRKLVTNFTSIAKDFGCELVLEGIEDPATAEAAASLGIRYGQGYLFGRPNVASAYIHKTE